MKKINEMTDQELVKAIETLKDVEEMKTVVEQLKAEQVVREKTAEAKRLEEENKRKADEAKRNADAEKEENDLVEKQKSVLGKYFKRTLYDVNYKTPVELYTAFYKVLGVYENLVVVSVVKRHNNYVSRSTEYLPLNDLIKVDGKDFKVSTRLEYNEQYKNSLDGIGSLIADLFKPFIF